MQQIEQFNSQQNESFESGVFRIFQALKPEVEGLSVRIISKAYKAKIISDDDESFCDLLKKYQGGEKTVFLRTMQKDRCCNAICSSLEKKESEELLKTMKRFANIMKLLRSSIKKTADNSDDDFANAIKATEIYSTYKKYEKILENI